MFNMSFEKIKKLFIPLTNRKVIIILFITGFTVYSKIFTNSFVWDDYTFIINYPGVHQLNLPLLLSRNEFNFGPFYRPIPAVYFSVLYSLFGNSAFFYHIIQLTLHIIVTFLLFVFLSFFFSGSISFFLCLVFLVHPINVESVAYIGSTQSELYSLPGLLALILARKKFPSLYRLISINLLLLLSIFTKETGFLFIIMLLLFRYLFRLRKIKEFTFSAGVIVTIYALCRMFIGKVTYSPALEVPI